MTLETFWTAEAEETFDIIVNYLENNWGESVAKKFIHVTHQKLSLIIINPYLYRASPINQVRQMVVTPQTSLFMRSTIVELLFYSS